MLNRRKLILAAGIGTVGSSMAGFIAYVRRDRAIVVSDEERRAALNFKPDQRSRTLEALQSTKFDLLVIGAGSTGSGCALDAATRGLRVACVDSGDFCSGTSSKSTKLIHGGVRYLEKAVKSLSLPQFALVREALAERSTLRRTAPHLTSALPIMLPIYSRIYAPYFWAGSKMYDAVAWFNGATNLHRSYWCDAGRVIEEFPGIKRDGLVGAMVYYDGQQDDARTGLAIALTAMHHGAQVANYVKITGLIKNEQGKIIGANARDEITGSEMQIRATGIINATGPYCDNIRAMDDPSHNVNRMVIPSLGAHIALEGASRRSKYGLLDPSTSDGRVLFVLPWEGSTIIGTTDDPLPDTKESMDHPYATNSAVTFTLDSMKKFFEPGCIQAHIGSMWAGIRALVKEPEGSKASGSTENLVRSHCVVYNEKSGLLTITGGKWTTYRQMAEDTIDEAIKRFDLKPMRHTCITDKVMLIGGHGLSASDRGDFILQRERLRCILKQHYPQTYEESIDQLVDSYGDRALAVMKLVHEYDSKRLVPKHLYKEGEVIYAVRSECALNAVDVLARRTRLAFIDVLAAKEALPRVLELMQKELGWSKEELIRQRAQAEEFFRAEMGLDEVETRKREQTAATDMRRQHLFKDRPYSEDIEMLLST